MKCRFCGYNAVSGEKFCPSCGTPIVYHLGEKEQVPSKEMLIVDQAEKEHKKEDVLEKNCSEEIVKDETKTPPVIGKEREEQEAKKAPAPKVSPKKEKDKSNAPKPLTAKEKAQKAKENKKDNERRRKEKKKEAHRTREAKKEAKKIEMREVKDVVQCQEKQAQKIEMPETKTNTSVQKGDKKPTSFLWLIGILVLISIIWWILK